MFEISDPRKGYPINWRLIIPHCHRNHVTTSMFRDLTRRAEAAKTRQTLTCIDRALVNGNCPLIQSRTACTFMQTPFPRDAEGIDSRLQQDGIIMADATATPAPTTTARRRADLQAQPASPPLPNPHTPVAPGPRATRLQELYASSLSHTLARLGWDNFASCYPTMALRAPATLRTVQRQMVDRLGELCNVRLQYDTNQRELGTWVLHAKHKFAPQKEFQVILEQRDVVTKLNELEGLVSDAARRRDTSTTATIP